MIPFPPFPPLLKTVLPAAAGILSLFSSGGEDKQKIAELERQIALQNLKIMEEHQEKLRLRQEARQNAENKMYELQSRMIADVNNKIDEVLDNVISAFQEKECKDKELFEDSRRKLLALANIRKPLNDLENKLL